ncbi:LLM class flavin-dependent oxidoreductase [Streptomyces sp. NPDC102462]|uniref:LLM class flavin-dependent oxidoreductase n=1 Tax=Streptomyces sp. NPDC102462 TaxID=3366178 RepID=UPI003816C31B
MILLAHLSGATEHLGFVITSSTTYNSPYNLARRFNALDHVSKGRAAVNIVTTATPAAAANLGAHEHPDRDARYRRAHEFLDVVTRLWDAWEPGAVVGDRTSGRYADRAVSTPSATGASSSRSVVRCPCPPGLRGGP